MGRDTKGPPQLGQRPPSLLSTQPRQKVHSNEQIIASVDSGGRSLSQHSQLGRNSSMDYLSSSHLLRVCAVSVIFRLEFGGSSAIVQSPSLRRKTEQ
jgi:hypothetical protein